MTKTKAITPAAINPNSVGGMEPNTMPLNSKNSQATMKLRGIRKSFFISPFNH